MCIFAIKNIHNIIMYVLKYFLVINVFLIIFVAVYEINNPKNLLFWSSIILLFSIFGFIAYVIFGNALKFNAKDKYEIDAFMSFLL